MNQSLIPTDAANARVTLSPSARRYVQASKAQNTLDTYKFAWARFLKYCAVNQTDALPASSQTVVDYLTALADMGRKPSTIEVHRAAIAHRHRANEMPDPTLHQAVLILMEGIRRTLKHEPHRQAPLTRPVLKKVVAPLSEDLRDLRDRALLLVNFDGAFRESELVALNVGDVEFRADGMVITVRSSKTDQKGAGQKKFIAALSDQNTPLCPVTALVNWLSTAEIESGPLFRKVDRWGHVWDRRMNRRAVEFIVKRGIARVGGDPTKYAGHSGRAGFVTQAARDGVPEYQIQAQTGHTSSDMLRRYIRDEGLGQQEASRKVLGD